MVIYYGLTDMGWKVMLFSRDEAELMITYLPSIDAGDLWFYV